jgi:hypothetical protein
MTRPARTPKPRTPAETPSGKRLAVKKDALKDLATTPRTTKDVKGGSYSLISRR